jgi:prolipoprotein diacylglyceryl transferase
MSYFHWDASPELINVFGVSLTFYGLLFTSGLALSVYALKWMFEREKLDSIDLDRLSIYGFLGVLIGARLGHCLFYDPSYYLSHPIEMLLPIHRLEGGGFEFIGYRGLASHGGVLGVIIVLIVFAKKNNLSIIKLLDLLAVVAPIGGVFIRLANFMNSEINGIPTTVPWAVVFERIDNIPRHPAQLYEAISYLFIFVIMMSLYLQKRIKFPKGFLFGAVLILIFVARFLIEFVKINQVDFEDDMTIDMGQILSLPYIFAGIFIIGLSYYKQSQSKSKVNEN